MTLSECILSNRPTEKGGPIAQRGFTYQSSWAIAKMIDLFKLGDDFVMLIEHQDDLQVLDSSSSPSKIEFYQVKTKDSGILNWSKIIARKKASASILEKMCKHFFNHIAHNVKVFIVTNARYDFKLKDDTRISTRYARIKLSEVADRQYHNLKKKVAESVPDFDLDKAADDIVFISSRMPLSTSRDFVIAKLVDFFESHGENTLPGKITPFFNALTEEIRKKAEYEFDVSTIEEMIDVKGISRGYFDQMIQVANRSVESQDSKISLVVNRLDREGAPLSLIRKVRRSEKEFQSHLVGSNSRLSLALEKEISEIRSKLEESHSLPDSLLEIGSEIVKNVKKRYIFSDDYLLTLAYLSCYD